MEAGWFKARPGPMFGEVLNAPGEGQQLGKESTAGSPFGLGTPFKVPSRRMLLTEPEATSAGKSSFELPKRATSVATSDCDEGVQLPVKRHKLNDDVPLPSSSLDFKPSSPFGTSESFQQAKPSLPGSPLRDPNAPPSEPLFRDKRIQVAATSGPRQEEETMGKPQSPAKPSEKPPSEQLLLAPSLGLPGSIRKSDPSAVRKSPLSFTFAAKSALPPPSSTPIPLLPKKTPSFSSAGLSFQIPPATKSSPTPTLFAGKESASRGKQSPLTFAPAPGFSPSTPKIGGEASLQLPPLVADDDKPPVIKAAPWPKLNVGSAAPTRGSAFSSPASSAAPKQFPLERPPEGTAKGSFSLHQTTPKAPSMSKGVGLDFFPRAISAKRSESPAPKGFGFLGGAQRQPADPLSGMMGGSSTRGPRALPDTRHVDELETTFLNKAQEFSKRLEEMNEGLAEAAEKLKEQAVHLYVLNNDALFMNSPALSDRVAALRAQLKEMRVDMGGLALTQEKEE